MLNRGTRKKKDHQRQFPVDSFHFFTTSWRKMRAPGPFFPSSRSIFVASTGRIYLRWVYLRTKWFLFGLRASCASHGGFVAAIAAAAPAGEREWDRPTRAKTRYALEENFYMFLLFLASLNLPSYIHDLPVCAFVQLCMRVHCACDRPKNGARITWRVWKIYCSLIYA